MCCVIQIKQKKVNVKIWTETELIAVDDAWSCIQLARNFTMDLGYALDTFLKEDDRSTILLMKNGKISSGKRTKHYISDTSMSKIL